MIDLHLHLDGALTPEDVKYLAEIQGIQLPDDYKSQITCPALCTSLNDFLRCFAIPTSVTQTKESIYEGTKRILTRLASQGLVYAEIRFSPQLQTVLGMTQEEAVSAVIKAEEDMKSRIESGLILCYMRHSINNELNFETLKVAKKYLGRGVDAVDLAGAEGLYKTSLFQPLFAATSKEGIPCTIHAGEADGASSVEAALDFGAKRIGHGVHALESEKTMQRMISEQIPFELCVTSEIQTKCVPSLKEYPIRQLMESGAFLTINTDDQGISDITLNSEYRLLKKNFGITKEETRGFIQNAIGCSFASEEKKARIQAKADSSFDTWYNENIA
jgi:adenosine deaminase